MHDIDNIYAHLRTVSYSVLLNLENFNSLYPSFEPDAVLFSLCLSYHFNTEIVCIIGYLCMIIQ